MQFGADTDIYMVKTIYGTFILFKVHQEKVFFFFFTGLVFHLKIYEN